MKLWLISQSVNIGYDTFDAAVVAAKNEEEAKRILPAEWAGLSEWTTPEFVQVQFIGTAIKEQTVGVVLASFNAG